jgi:Domain of unknown function (DUF5664)
MAAPTDGNPKTAMGMLKPDLSVVPPIAFLHLATAMMNGDVKYGAFNYRKDKVSSRVYVAAAMRHLLSYLDGEDFSQDTVDGAFMFEQDPENNKPIAVTHHLAHVMACCAIVLDAEACGMLLDNRPDKGSAGTAIEQFSKTRTLHYPSLTSKLT